MDLTLRRRFKDDEALVSWILDEMKECGGSKNFFSWFAGYFMAGNGIIVNGVSYTLNDCIVRFEASESYSRV